MRQWFVCFALSIVCAAVTALALLGVWGAFDARKTRREVQRMAVDHERLTVQTIAIVRLVVTMAERLAVPEPVNRGLRAGRRQEPDQGTGEDPPRL